MVILGAGLAGTLTAWKLRHQNHSIVLYQTTDENELLFKTETIQIQNMTYNLEVGVPWLSLLDIPEDFSDILNQLDLQIETSEETDITYNLRGQDFTSQTNISNLYHTNYRITKFDPVATLQNVLQEWLAQITENDRAVTFPADGTVGGNLYELNVSLKDTAMNNSKKLSLEDYVR